MFIPYSDKGWLRAHDPKAKQHQIVRFIAEVDRQLSGIKQPAPEKRNSARVSAFNIINGCTL